MQCPQCGALEDHPTRDDAILIRGCKVHDKHGVWSQCLVCSGYYDEDLKEQPTKHRNNKGWFVELTPIPDGVSENDHVRRLMSGPVEVLTQEEFNARQNA